MAIGEVVENLSEIVVGLPPNIANSLGGLITIFKAAGIVLIAYVAYIVVKSVFRIRDRKRLKVIEKKVLDIDKKLNKLLGLKKEEKKRKK